jgi:zinc resistance-associated protein
MIALCAALLATGAFAQDRGDRGRGGQRNDHEWGDEFRRGGREGGGVMGRFSPEDLEAFVDARIAGLRAGLKLTSEQEKLWPALEDAIRTLVRQRREQARVWRESRERFDDDVSARLRAFAEQQAARADALRKLADAVSPLYASFDEGQKRRFNVLARRMRAHAMRGMGGRTERWRDRL